MVVFRDGLDEVAIVWRGDCVGLFGFEVVIRALGRTPKPSSGYGCVPRHPLQIRVMVGSDGLGDRRIHVGFSVSAGWRWMCLALLSSTQRSTQ
ncbi:hypothetical protein IFO70_02685 [Phormidium tenue FACHB-886]|nr:hypothetical protein [Phormidium tenue FACHB-886]